MNQLLFQSLDLSPSLLQVLKELGFDQMTPIQAQSIPFLLEGRDLVGESKTGSGKTAAFGLPILQKLKLADRQIQALILCPTRELCTQVAREMRRLGRKQAGLQVACFSGGQPIHPQLMALEQGVHCVVGTPGRVLDHLKRNSQPFQKVQTLVLDEADRMLDMGFEDQMDQILEALPKSRQTVFFSATYPSTIASMSRAHQKNPVQVKIEESEKTAPSIRQVVYEVDASQKLTGLLWLIQQTQPESAIVFCNLKAHVMDLVKVLVDAGVCSAGLHGDLEQVERDRVMAKFRNGSTRILVATDVAARGLDVENLDAVYNFDLPLQPEIYVHRIGRTGRAGKKGSALALATPRQKSIVENIEKYTGKKIEEKTFPDLSHLGNDHFKKTLQQDAAMVTLYVSGGRKEKMRPGDLLGALTGEAGGLAGTDVGKIEIHDHFSYVAISKAVAATALQRMRMGRIKGRHFRVEYVR